MNIDLIINAIESAAPRRFQEAWDNSGLQVSLPKGQTDITGVLLCLDVTEAVVDEALAKGCNLIVSHHPLIFKGFKSLTDATPSQRAAIAAVRAGVAVYSAHTSLDSAPCGVSHAMARRMGLDVKGVLAPSPADTSVGLGVVGEFPADGLAAADFVCLLNRCFGTKAIKLSGNYMPGRMIRRVALCGGSGGEFIGTARACGADAYVSGDIRYHDFADAAQEDMLVADIGHFESESCAKDIFYQLITNNFPNFAVYYSETATNPVVYMTFDGESE